MTNERPDELIELWARATEHRPVRLPYNLRFDDVGRAIWTSIRALESGSSAAFEEEVIAAHRDEIFDTSGLVGRLLVLSCVELPSVAALMEALVSLNPTLEVVLVGEDKRSLEGRSQAILEVYPTVEVSVHAGPFPGILKAVSTRTGPATVAYVPGALFGCLGDVERKSLLLELRRLLRGSADSIVLGTQMQRSPGRERMLHRDALGLHRALNMNCLRRIAKALGEEPDLGAFRHRVESDGQRGEMRLSLVAEGRCQIGGVWIEEGEAIYTGVLKTFDPGDVQDLAMDIGYSVEHSWYEQGRRWALHLLAVIDP